MNKNKHKSSTGIVKACWLPTTAILASLCLDGAVTQSLGQTLIAHWTFDEGAGTLAQSQVNSPATDGVFAPPPNEPTWDTVAPATIPGSLAALHLDGNFDSVLLDPVAVAPAAGYTIAGWVNVEAYTADSSAGDNIFGLSAFGAPWIPTIRLSMTEFGHPQGPGRIFTVARDALGNDATVFDSVHAALGQWTHCAVTFDAGTGILSL
ncbi:MAG: LamG domain-containing protein [Verrucomicrobia bacterium]|nr:LamG domain-containing protein [Verrucomicrobiota bacterium]